MDPGNTVKKETEIRIVKAWPASELIELYKAAGWWQASDDESLAERIVAGSYAFAVAVNPGTGKAVGMGRVLSDGASDAYIQDVTVLPGHRGKETGRRIIVALRDHCLERRVSWIALIAEPGTKGFYRDLGFTEMDDHTPMRYMEAGR